MISVDTLLLTVHYALSYYTPNINIRGVTVGLPVLLAPI